MSFDHSEAFTKDNLDRYLNELSKEYKKLGGRNVPVEIVLIGGAAVIENYGFRDMTTDVDAIMPDASIMKEAIQRVSSRFGLPEDWLNADFIMTDSYSPYLYEHSVYYRTFNQVLQVRTIGGEYLIAMKLRAGRKYKNDLSDVVGILAEHQQKETPISYERIDSAVKALYGGWEQIPEHSVTFIHDILNAKDYSKVYQVIRKSEMDSQNVLMAFENQHPGEVREKHIDSILEAGAKHGNRLSILAQLRALQNEQESDDQNTTDRDSADRDHRRTDSGPR